MDLQDLLTFCCKCSKPNGTHGTRGTHGTPVSKNEKTKIRAYEATRLGNGSPSLAEQFIDVSVTHPFDTLSHISLDKSPRNLGY